MSDTIWVPPHLPFDVGGAGIEIFEGTGKVTMRWSTDPALTGLSWAEYLWIPPLLGSPGVWLPSGRGRTDASVTAYTEQFNGADDYAWILFRTQALKGVGRNSYYVGQYVTVTFTGAVTVEQED